MPEGYVPFSVGVVLRRSLSAFFKHPFIFIGLSFIAELHWFAYMFLTGRIPGRSDSLPEILSGAIVELIFELMIQGAVTCAVYEMLRGNPARFGQSLVRSLSRLASLLGAALCYLIFCFCLGVFPALFVLYFMGWEMGITLLFFIVLVMWCKWSATVPVCAVERLGPIESMNRSSELSKGCRLELAGIYALYAVVMVILFVVWKPGVRAFLMKNFGSEYFRYYFYSTVIAARFIVAASTVFFHILTAVSYYSLREAREGKEGTAVERTAGAFD